MRKQPPPVQQELFAKLTSPKKGEGPSRLAERPAERPPEPAKPPLPRVLTVTELTAQLKATLQGGFGRVLVRGEVSGFRGPNPRGHLYFALKDAGASIDARVWASTAARLPFQLKEGMAVVAEGALDVYEPAGRYSLIAHRLEPEGVGALALAFEQLKAKLAAEGLLGDRRLRAPRPLPFLPRRIGVVTSVAGAALRDFLRVLHQRNPRLSVLVCDARVQGDGAAREVVRALRWLSRTDVDVIVVTRGGGSIEDLWTFNTEVVARAIHACPVPVVSAIGHEVDFTIADFVADLRASTPSAAAERLSPVLRDLHLSLDTQRGRLIKAAERAVLERRQRLDRLARALTDPRRALGHSRLHLNERVDALERAARRVLRESHDRLRGLAERLRRLNPHARLAADRALLNTLTARLVESGRGGLVVQRERLAAAHRRLVRRAPLGRLHDERERLSALRSRLCGGMREASLARQASFRELVTKLSILSPLSVMARGYALAFREDGHLVRGAGGLTLGDRLSLRLAHAAIERLEQSDQVDVQVLAVRPGIV